MSSIKIDMNDIHIFQHHTGGEIDITQARRDDAELHADIIATVRDGLDPGAFIDAHVRVVCGADVHHHLTPQQALDWAEKLTTAAREAMGDPHDETEVQANRQMIEAAPELLEALAQLDLSCLDDALNPCWDGQPHHAAGMHWSGLGPSCPPCTARATLAKARGES